MPKGLLLLMLLMPLRSLPSIVFAALARRQLLPCRVRRVITACYVLARCLQHLQEPPLGPPWLHESIPPAPVPPAEPELPRQGPLRAVAGSATVDGNALTMTTVGVLNWTPCVRCLWTLLMFSLLRFSLPSILVRKEAAQHPLSTHCVYPAQEFVPDGDERVLSLLTGGKPPPTPPLRSIPFQLVGCLLRGSDVGYVGGLHREAGVHAEQHLLLQPADRQVCQHPEQGNALSVVGPQDYSIGMPAQRDRCIRTA